MAVAPTVGMAVGAVPLAGVAGVPATGGSAMPTGVPAAPGLMATPVAVGLAAATAVAVTVGVTTAAVATVETGAVAEIGGTSTTVAAVGAIGIVCDGTMIGVVPTTVGEAGSTVSWVGVTPAGGTAKPDAGLAVAVAVGVIAGDGVGVAPFKGSIIWLVALVGVTVTVALGAGVATAEPAVGDAATGIAVDEAVVVGVSGRVVAVGRLPAGPGVGAAGSVVAGTVAPAVDVGAPAEVEDALPGAAVLAAAPVGGFAVAAT